MKKNTVKSAAICLLSAILILSCASLFACSSKDEDASIKEFKSEYADKHTEENLIATAKLDKETEICAYLFAVEDSGAVLEIKKKDSQKIIESISLPEEGEYYTVLDMDFASQNTVFQDMNFDGFIDLYVPCSVITPNLEGMAWLWDSEKSKFILSEELSSLYELCVFPEDELITSQDYSDPSAILCKEFIWENGKLVQVGEYTVNK
ncbi:MAG: hypothetical protein E7575_05080 [Ruminococcaceae bacterium]|nr:hypothetical protein [Oscillospiraceae bacterium]